MTDVWSHAYPSILLPDSLARIQQIVEQVGPVLVEHRRYRGASAPTLLVFCDHEDLEVYVRERAVPGDSFFVWSLAECCTDANVAVRGKLPDAQGRTPESGAY